MSISQNYPTIVPSLSLDFSNVKALDPRVTFARASSATYYGTETAKAEENLLIRSQEFDNAGWAPNGATVTANDTTAPDGTTTAEKLATSSGSTSTRIQQSARSVLGDSYTISVHAKKGDNRNFLIITDTLFATAGSSVWFDLDTGTVGTVQRSASHTASIIDVGNGWYRCVVSFVASLGNNGIVRVSNAEVDNSITVTDNGGFIFIWGAQLEQRSAVTAYTPTTDQPITRFQPVLELEPAGVARFDHDPLTFESLGLLVEEQRTNLLVRSEEFDNAGWTKGNATITANTIVAPDGTLTGDKFVINDGISSSSSSFRSADLSKAASPVTFAFSIYAKAGEHNTLRLLPRDVATSGNNADVRFNLTNGTVISAVANGTYTAVAGVITSVGNDWYRCTALFTTGSETTVRFQVLQLNNNGIVTGNGFSGIFIWGAQLEEGAFPTSYIKTEASQVTRSADSASMTGANFSSWYRADEGTLYVESRCPNGIIGNINRIASLNDGSTSNRIEIDTGTAAATSVRILTNAANQGQLTAGVYTDFQLRKSALGIQLNNFTLAANSLTNSNTSVLIPVVDRLMIGQSPALTSSFLNGTIRKLSFYPQRISNTQLQALTS